MAAPGWSSHARSQLWFTVPLKPHALEEPDRPRVLGQSAKVATRRADLGEALEPSIHQRPAGPRPSSLRGKIDMEMGGPARIFEFAAGSASLENGIEESAPQEPGGTRTEEEGVPDSSARHCLRGAKSSASVDAPCEIADDLVFANRHKQRFGFLVRVVRGPDLRKALLVEPVEGGRIAHVPDAVAELSNRRSVAGLEWTNINGLQSAFLGLRRPTDRRSAVGGDLPRSHWTSRVRAILTRPISTQREHVRCNDMLDDKRFRLPSTNHLLDFSEELGSEADRDAWARIRAEGDDSEEEEALMLHFQL
jgi:hypothetical protein